MRLPRPLYDQLRRPSSKIGPGWRSVFFTKLPHLFRRFSEARRLRIVRTYLGPAPGYFVRDRVIGRVAVHCGLQVEQAKPSGHGVLLTLVSTSGDKREFQADHVICGTGYRSELARLPFLDDALLPRIDAVQGTPILSANFECSIPGLYFVGAIAANTFGPVLRFACGAEFAAPRVARHLSRRHKRLATRGGIVSKPLRQAAQTTQGPGSALGAALVAEDKSRVSSLLGGGSEGGRRGPSQ
jgi:hypothetical protein